MVPHLLAIASAVTLSGAAAIISFLRLHAITRAEHSLVNVLRRDWGTFGKELAGNPATLQSVIESLSVKSPDRATLQRVQAVLVRAAALMSKRDRDLVIGPLHQQSERGRADYLVKLVKKVGDPA